MTIIEVVVSMVIFMGTLALMSMETSALMERHSPKLEGKAIELKKLNISIIFKQGV